MSLSLIHIWQVGFAAGAHRYIAGVGQHGHARVGNKGQVAPLAQQAQDLVLFPILIVIVQADQTLDADAPTGTCLLYTSRCV